ncbi:MAG: DoxX family protein [Solirubrobacteraceae bacterium]
MRIAQRLAGPFFVFAGAMHFVTPRTYRRIVPPYVPAPGAIVYASGVAEIAGGLGLTQGRHRRLAGWWLLATLAAVFPANVHMALHPDAYPRIPGGAVSLWARLPFQGVFAAWVLAAMRRTG